MTTKEIEQQEEEHKEEEEVNPALDPNFYYEEDYQCKEFEETPIRFNSVLKFATSYGFDSYKKNNVQILDNDNIIYAQGVSYEIYNIKTQNSKIFFSRDKGGIGAIAVHPNNSFFAIGEKGDHPNIYIYEYPSLKLYRILREGTESSFSCLNFSQNGDQLVSVGSGPDYNICLWDWKTEIKILRSKAFSQEVYTVSFSHYSEDILASSGLGHIKFWKVCKTFTGLKLKGEIAKFGQVELSDVVTYYVFQDGKVLSGSEQGWLLLWEGNLIKCLIKESEKTLCHDGQINMIFKHDSDIITAGSDGKIKFWDSSVIDQSEPDDRGEFYLQPKQVIEVVNKEGVLAKILDININNQNNSWIISDSLGKIYELSSGDYQQKTVLSTNSGKIMDIAIGEVLDLAVSIGSDGCVRMWDYILNKEIYSRQFLKQGTCLEWVPYSFSRLHEGRVLIAGFDNGVVRWLLLNHDNFYLLKAEKVHKSAIKKIQCNPSGDTVCILDVKGDIFFIEQNKKDLQKLEPFCFYQTGVVINDFQWDRRGEKVIFAGNDGYVYELQVPSYDQCDYTQTYEQEFNATKWRIQMMESQKPKTEEMDLEFLLKRSKNEDKKDQEWDPEPILTINYYKDTDTILLTADGKFAGQVYFVNMQKERPIKSFPISKKVSTTSLTSSQDKEILIITYSDGSYWLMQANDFEKYVEVKTHDKDYGTVRRVRINQEKSYVFSCAEDGTMYSYLFDYSNFQNANNQDGLFPTLSSSWTDNTFEDKVTLIEQNEEDIFDDDIYSIQQAKILKEEDYKRKEAEKRKIGVLQVIKSLVDQYEQLKLQNEEIENIARLSQNEMTVDPQYVETLNQRVMEDLEESKMQLKYEAEFQALKTQKLKSYMKDELAVDRFGVMTISQPFQTVYTFKIKNLSEYVREELKKIYLIIESERMNQEEQNQNPQIQIAALNTMANNQTIKKDKEEKKEEITEQPPEGLTGAKLEKWKFKREEAHIRRQLELLELQRPSNESIDPDHQKEIASATDQLGDFKLKSDKNYNVPENQRMNDSKKRKHMFLLEEFIHNTKLKFNNEIISLRERKKQIIEKSQQYNKRIQQINQQLGIKETLVDIKISTAVEEPEQAYQINEEQIDTFEKQIEAQALRDKGKKGVNTQIVDEKKVIQSQKAIEKESIINGFKKRNTKQQLTVLEEEEKQIEQMILLAEKQKMQEVLKEEIEQLDKDITTCIKEKNILESDLTVGSMKLTTFYQELLILQNMKFKDDQLIARLNQHKLERNELDEQSHKITSDLQALNAKDQETEKKLQEEMKLFKSSVHPEEEGKREKIHQYYLRKHKKQQAKQLKIKNSEENEDEMDEDEIESEESDDSEFLEDDDDEKPDISAVDQDQQIKSTIDKICEYEIQQEQTKKDKMELERNKTQLHTKAQVVLKNLNAAELDLKLYQRKKLQRVNQLDVSYCLRIDQIQNGLVDDNHFKLPENLEKSILFTQNDYDNLGTRIRELKEEQINIGQKQSKLEKRNKALEHKKKVKEIESDKLNKKLNEKHQLKFGDFIDLKILDALEPTAEVLNMKKKFMNEEKNTIKQIEKAKQQLLDKKKNLVVVKKKNTLLFEKITSLGTDKMSLDTKLDSTNKQLLKEENEEKKYKNDLEREKQNLYDLVRFLKKEIEDLKTEIGLFKRKGGHIYTMVTSNKK